MKAVGMHYNFPLNYVFEMIIFLKAPSAHDIENGLLIIQ